MMGTHGMLPGAWGPSRPEVVPADWGEDFSWLDPGTEPNHPWNPHYMGVCNIVDAAEMTSCRHVIMMSDAKCALPPINPDALARSACHRPTLPSFQSTHCPSPYDVS